MSTSPHTPTPCTPSRTRPCARCGVPLPESPPAGLCPSCVLGQALGEATRAGSGPGPEALNPAPILPSSEQVAKAFPQLEVVARIGAGGMGVVFKARQRHLDRWVALKLLPESLSRQPHFVERFHREARVLARLNHPNIVTVYDFGEAGGFPFLLMEFVDGVNLREAMQTGRFSPQDTLALVVRLCEALQFAHEEGVLHRDIKPENILLDTRGRVKIADFGIAKLLGSSRADLTLTASGASVGTPQYMAPEQLEQPQEVDHRADIYSLGVVFYEMLTGELPLGRFAPPSEKAPVDLRVDAIVLRALAKERERRQQSATQVRTEVEEVRTPGPAPSPDADPSLGSSRGSVGLARESGGGSPPVPEGGGDGSSGGGSTARRVGVGDFVLCNPALPAMARWITVFALVVAPAMLLLGWMSDLETELRSPYAHFVHTVSVAVEVVAGGGLTLLLMAGGWRLRGLHPAGPRWIRTALAGELVLGVLLTGAFLFQESLEDRWRTAAVAPAAVADLPKPTSPGSADAIVVVLGLGSLAFEIWALVWMSRHRHRLDRILAEARPGCALAAAEMESSLPAIGVVPGATSSFVLTGLSLALGLASLGFGTMACVPLDRADSRGGLGALDLGLLVAGAGVMGVMGVGGALMAWAALRRHREAVEPLGGLRRSLFGLLAWPATVGALGILVCVAGGAMACGIVPMAAVLLGSGAAWGAVVFAYRGGWRRWRRGAGFRVRGYLPLWVFGLAAVQVFLVVGTLLPAATLQFRASLLASLPTLRLVVQPDPPVGAGTHHGRGAMQVGLEYPARSLVWLETSLWKDGRLWQTPCSTMHVLNSEFDPMEGTLLVRPVEPRPGSAGRWELLLQVPGREPVIWLESPTMGPGAWTVRGASEPLTAEPGSPVRWTILDGTDAEGLPWWIILEIRVEPLLPTILGSGGMAAIGRDWSGTARLLDPDAAAGTAARGAVGDPGRAGANPAREDR